MSRPEPRRARQRLGLSHTAYRHSKCYESVSFIGNSLASCSTCNPICSYRWTGLTAVLSNSPSQGSTIISNTFRKWYGPTSGCVWGTRIFPAIACMNPWAESNHENDSTVRLRIQSFLKANPPHGNAQASTARLRNRLRQVSTEKRRASGVHGKKAAMYACLTSWPWSITVCRVHPLRQLTTTC